MIIPKNKILKIPMVLSSSVGIWPIIFEDNSHFKKLYDIFATILYYYYLGFILRAYFQLAILLTAEELNIEEILGNLCITLIYTVSMFRLKAFNTEAIKTLFKNIINTEEKILKNTDDYEVKKIYLAGVKVTRIYHILFFFNGWLVSFLYFIHPLFMELPTMVVGNKTVILRTLPLSTWWPIDIQKYYLTAYFWNIFDGTLGSSFVINSDLLTFSLVIFAISQLDILSYTVRNFKSSSKLTYKENNRKFIELIKNHYEIINYIDTFNEGMKYVMLFDFLQCSIQLATIILQLHVMEINVPNVIFVGEFFLTMLLRLVIYYSNGHKIIYKSESLAVDIWSTNWYEENEDLKKMMKIFMIRAQRPLKFMIGPFGAMSLDTFIAILKTTYSYMMLFINAH